MLPTYGLSIHGHLSLNLQSTQLFHKHSRHEYYAIEENRVAGPSRNSVDNDYPQ